MNRSRLRSDSGFTMIELLVVITIGSIVVLAITAVMITAFKTQDDTASRLAASHDTQLVATWLPFDTSSAAISLWSSAQYPSGNDNPCLAAAGGASVMKLPYVAISGDSQQVANWRLEQDGSARDLVRYQCVAGNTPSRIVLANT